MLCEYVSTFQGDLLVWLPDGSQVIEKVMAMAEEFELV